VPTHPREAGAQPSRIASREDLRRVLGDLDDPKIMEVLALEPSVTDLEEANVCLAGDHDVLAKRGHFPSARAVRIAEILTPEDDDEEPPSRAPFDE
jgi:hypothetical protein